MVPSLAASPSIATNLVTGGILADLVHFYALAYCSAHMAIPDLSEARKDCGVLRIPASNTVGGYGWDREKALQQ